MNIIYLIVSGSHIYFTNTSNYIFKVTYLKFSTVIVKLGNYLKQDPDINILLKASDKQFFIIIFFQTLFAFDFYI